MYIQQLFIHHTYTVLASHIYSVVAVASQYTCDALEISV